MRRFRVSAAAILMTGFTWSVHAQKQLGFVVDPKLLPLQVAGFPIPAGQVDMALSALDGLAQKLLDTTKILGLAIAVVRDGKVAHAKGFGIRKIGEPERVDADTIFQRHCHVNSGLTATV
jgi:CubicO group peptidase (beta-lactamase class C family)